MASTTNNTVTLTFAVNVAPYAEGLKSMLSMTQVTGAQIKPLLNFEMKKADFSGIEKVLDSYAQKVKDLIPAQQELADSSEGLGNANDDESEKVKRSKKSHEEKALTLNKVKRESLEAFGAIAFLTQNIVSLAAANSNGSKEMDKLNQGLSQGISAGFGLAGILGTLGIATGGVGVAIGAVVAVGVTLLAFLDKSKEKSEQNKKTMDEFAASLRGAALPALIEYRNNVSQWEQESKKNIETESKKLAVLKESGKNYKNVGDYLIAVRAQTLAVTNAENEFIRAKETGKKLDEQITGGQKTYAEIRTFIRESEIAAIYNQYARQRAEAKSTYESELLTFVHSKEAQTAAFHKYETKVREINTAEKADAAQKAKEITEAEKREFEKRKQAYDQHLKSVEQLSVLDLTNVLLRLRQRGMEQGKTEEQIALDITNRKQTAADAELKILTDLEKSGIALNDEQKIAKTKLENDLVQLQIDGANQRKAIDKSETEHAKEMYDAKLNAAQQMFGNMAQAAGNIYEMQQRQTNKELNAELKVRNTKLKLERDKQVAAATTAEQRQAVDEDFAEKQEALQQEMNDRAMAANEKAFAFQKAFSIIQAMMSTYTAAALALGPPPLGLGPVLGIPLAATAVALGLANVAMIASQQPPGLARGGTVKGVGGPQDDNILMRLSVGEEVINSRAAKNNRMLLKAINSVGQSGAISYMDAMPSVRSDYFSSTPSGGRRVSSPSMSSGEGGSSGSVVYNITIPIENFYGEEKEFDRLKKTVEGAMQRAGTDDASTLFKNRNRI
ncbi:MAG: hypothetical protein Q8L88_02225 [Bacteroidota bacterium]|nr:hypothetical protein [Bacteroidota bacterium]